MTVHFQADVGVGNVLQGFSNQAIEGFRPVGGELPAQGLVDGSNGRGAVDNKGAIILGNNVGAGGGVIRRKIPDDFFKYVFECRKTQDVTILIHNHTKPAATLLEIDELGVQRGAFRNEIGFLAKLHDHGLVNLLLLKQLRSTAQVEYALDVVDVAFVNRKSCVLAAAQLTQDCVSVVLQIDPYDLVAGHHDVIHGYFFEIEDADQHVLVLGWNQGSGLVHQCSEFFTTQVVVCSIRGRNAQQLENASGKQVYGPDNRVEDFQQWTKDVAGGKCDFLGKQCRQRFRGDFCKDQDNYG